MIPKKAMADVMNIATETMMKGEVETITEGVAETTTEDVVVITTVWIEMMTTIVVMVPRLWSTPTIWAWTMTARLELACRRLMGGYYNDAALECPYQHSSQHVLHKIKKYIFKSLYICYLIRQF